MEDELWKYKFVWFKFIYWIFLCSKSTTEWLICVREEFELFVGWVFASRAHCMYIQDFKSDFLQAWKILYYRWQSLIPKVCNRIFSFINLNLEITNNNKHSPWQHFVILKFFKYVKKENALPKHYHKSEKVTILLI